MPPKNVLIVTPCEKFISRLKSFLPHDVAYTTLQNLNNAAKYSYNYDVVLYDASSAHDHMTEDVRLLHSSYPYCVILIFCHAEQFAIAEKLLDLGASDYLDIGCVNSFIFRKNLRFACERKKLSTEKMC